MQLFSVHTINQMLFVQILELTLGKNDLAFWPQKQLFCAHIISRMLFVRILEVTYGKT